MSDHRTRVYCDWCGKYMGTDDEVDVDIVDNEAVILCPSCAALAKSENTDEEENHET